MSSMPPTNSASIREPGTIAVVTTRRVGASGPSPGSIAADGEILEIEPGRRVTMSFHPRWSPEIEAEGPARMTWTIEPGDGPGAPTRLVVTTAIVPGTRIEAEFVGGLELIVSGLKTLVETGQPLAVA